jgi:hypothetical protein
VRRRSKSESQTGLVSSRYRRTRWREEKTLDVAYAESSTTLAVLVLRMRADMGSRVCHVNHPSDVTTSSASDPIVRERLSAGSALSTSDNGQGLSGKQSVQGEPAKTYRPLHGSLDADIHSSPSPSRHISRLSAVLSRCFLTATRKESFVA